MSGPARFNPMRHRIPLLKRIVPSMKRRWWRLRHPDGWGTVSTQGARFRLNPNNFVDRQIAFYDDYERVQLDHLSHAMAERGCSRFLDIGAAFGYYSIILAARFPALAVSAVEPDPRNLAQLRQNLTLNGFQARIAVHAAAASAQAGPLAFAPAPAASTGQSKVAEDGNITVAALAIDEILHAQDQAIAVKIDVEGHEPAVLRGMERTLRTNDCILQIESYRDNVAEIGRYLGALGYVLDRVIEHDHYFVRSRPDTGSRARTAP
jgi:FkbM family methyltransferase